MKVAIVYNRESKRVINLFGLPNKEKYGRETIEKISSALRAGGHQVASFEGDKDLVDNLELFMPQVIRGERPGMVFNVSYGIQGQARYTHIPSILEMVGMPYIGSGPLAHSLSLDKVVSKMIFEKSGLPTPKYTVLEPSYTEIPQMDFPLIVKPKNEAVSFGLKVVHDEKELKEAVANIYNEYGQQVLVEEYIEGRELNIGLLGNSPTEVFEPCEIIFGSEGPRVYTYEDKIRTSGRSIGAACPADIDAETTERAKKLALKAFKALGCYDCARVDMRLTNDGQLYILEVNSLPSLGEHASYLKGASNYGLNFEALINRLVDVASQRYFGVVDIKRTGKARQTPKAKVSNYVVKNREKLENTVKKWVGYSSRTNDSIGISNLLAEFSENMLEMGFLPNVDYTDGHFCWMWQTKMGFEGGTILLLNIDDPLKDSDYRAPFKKEPEWIFGEGVASTKGSLAVLEFALRALRYAKQIDKKRIGIIAYSDEGLYCRHSAPIIKKVAQKAARVLVLKPTAIPNGIIVDRRGQRYYNFIAKIEPKTVEKLKPIDDLLIRSSAVVKEIKEACMPYKRMSVAMVEMQTKAHTMHAPHTAKISLLLNHANIANANKLEKQMHEIVGKHKKRYTLVKYAERPPLIPRRVNITLAEEIKGVAEEMDIHLEIQSSSWPSVAGLVPSKIPVVCGLGPYAKDLYTPTEAINRLGLIQRSLLLANLLVE